MSAPRPTADSTPACGSPATRSSRRSPAGAGAPQTILNVSYDPTRELYQEFTPRSRAPARETRAGDGAPVHAARKQARASSTAEAVVVTLALAWDVEALVTTARAFVPGGRGGCRTNSARTPPPSSSSCDAATQADSHWEDLAPTASRCHPNQDLGGARWNPRRWGMRSQAGGDAPRRGRSSEGAQGRGPCSTRGPRLDDDLLQRGIVRARAWKTSAPRREGRAGVRDRRPPVSISRSRPSGRRQVSTRRTGHSRGY